MHTTLTILHTNDLHSRFDGWTRVETVARRIRTQLGAETVLRLDAGDHGDRSFELTEATRARVNFALLEAAGVDAFTFGNNECLVWSPEYQGELASQSRVPCLGADLRLPDGAPIPGLRDSVIVERAGLRIGIFGVSRDVPDFLEPLGLKHRPPLAAIAECVADLRASGCDLVIFLSHMGYQNDQQTAAAVAGIDVIVGGHSHTALPQGERVGDTIIVQAGSFGAYLGRLDLTVSGGKVTDWHAELLPAGEEQPDPETVDLLKQWESVGAERLAEVVAHLPVPLPHDPLGDSPLAQLLVHRMQVKFGAEVSLTHGGVLLGGLPAGPVTRGDLLRICPCMLNPTLIRATGQQLTDLLAIPMEVLSQKAGRNGMRGDTPFGRIFGIGLEQLDPDRTYTVACNDYLAFGFTPFAPLKVPYETMQIEVKHLLRDTLAEALTGQLFRTGERIWTEAYDLNGVVKKRWQVEVVRSAPDVLITRQGIGEPVYMADGSSWLTRYESDAYYWPGKPYNLFRLFHPDGSWGCDYFNIATPATAVPGTIRYVDLELDVIHVAGQPPKLDDEDELEAAPYPPELKAKIRQDADELMGLLGTDRTPGGLEKSRPYLVQRRSEQP